MQVQGTPVPTPTPTITPTPTKTATPTPLAQGDPGFAYGIQAHMLGNDKPRVAGAIRDMGFGWVKQQVQWRDVELSRAFQLWDLDDVVNEANARGIRVLFSVVRSPGWASDHPDGPPRNFADFGDFMAALADRYKGRGMAYEIWNEQNLKREWMTYPLDPCKYVSLLNTAYTRIKAVDSTRHGDRRRSDPDRSQRPEHRPR